MLVFFLGGGVSVTHPMLALFSFFLFSSGEFLLHIPCYIHFSLKHPSSKFYLFFSLPQPPFFVFLLFLGLFFFFIWGFSLTHPVLPLFLSGEFLLHIPLLLYLSLRSFSCTSLASYIFIWGISLIHPMLVVF